MADRSPRTTYNVLRSLHHNKDIFQAGDVVELSEKEAEPLLKHKVVELQDVKGKKNAE